LWDILSMSQTKIKLILNQNINSKDARVCCK